MRLNFVDKILFFVNALSNSSTKFSWSFQFIINFIFKFFNSESEKLYHSFTKSINCNNVNYSLYVCILLLTDSIFSCIFKANSNRKIREEIITDVINLYNSNPTEESFRHYAENAQFEDPLQFSGNLSSVKSAFKSLTKVFNDSVVTRSDADIETNPMKLSLETHYEWKGIKKETVIRSIVLLTLNDQEQVIRHEERWDGEPIPNAESGFFGRIKEVIEFN